MIPKAKKSNGGPQYIPTLSHYTAIFGKSPFCLLRYTGRTCINPLVIVFPMNIP